MNILSLYLTCLIFSSYGIFFTAQVQDHCSRWSTFALRGADCVGHRLLHRWGTHILLLTQLLPQLRKVVRSLQDMIHIADTKVARRYGDYFLRQINKLQDVNQTLTR